MNYDVFTHKGVIFRRVEYHRSIADLQMTAEVIIENRPDTVSAELELYYHDGDVWHYNLKFSEDDVISGVYDWLGKREGKVPRWMLETVSYSMALKLVQVKKKRVECERRRREGPGLATRIWDELKREASD